jgi:Ca-activated chloride channel homolog
MFDLWPQIKLDNPWFLLLFLGFIPLLILDKKRKNRQVLVLPSHQNLSTQGHLHWVQAFLSFNKYLLLGLMILAMARPQSMKVSPEYDEKKGIDIMLSVDVSYSMLAKDLAPDRLTALKKIASSFVGKRLNDRVGLVAYSGEAFMKVPLTGDSKILQTEIEKLDPAELEGGTAIGEGLAVALNHLKDSKAKSKILILITDGVNTVQNSLDPLVAAEIAKNNQIKVYTIGIGTNGMAMMPVQQDLFGQIIYDQVPVSIDEKLLQQVAYITQGQYFRATDNQSLARLFDQIDQLETSEINNKINYQYTEWFRYLLLPALALLCLDALLRWGFYRRMI